MIQDSLYFDVNKINIQYSIVQHCQTIAKATVKIQQRPLKGGRYIQLAGVEHCLNRAH